MTYTLSALIAPVDILQVSTESDSLMQVVSLKQNFGIVPITKAVQKALVGEGEREFHEEHPFHYLSNGVQKFALDVSLAGHVAYVEAEFFGGVGYQTAILWKNGGAILGPFLAQNLPIREMPINRVLREMGVQTAEKVDEFDTLGLGQYRWTDDCLKRAT